MQFPNGLVSAKSKAFPSPLFSIHSTSLRLKMFQIYFFHPHFSFPPNEPFIYLP